VVGLSRADVPTVAKAGGHLLALSAGVAAFALQVVSPDAAQTSAHRVSYLAYMFDAGDPDYARNGTPCASGWDAHYNCHTPDSYMAQDICTIYTPQGNHILKFDTALVGDTKNGGCGYRAIKVTCHILNKLTAISETHSIRLLCGYGRDAAAKNFCLSRDELLAR
jgi:hypothetical protein